MLHLKLGKQCLVPGVDILQALFLDGCHTHTYLFAPQAKPHMLKSSVVDNVSGKSVASTVRTSTGTFLAKGADDVVTRIEKRVAQVTMIPVGECLVKVSHSCC